MGIIMLLSLYSSRLLLQRLGIDDYGLYNLVGSVVATIGMIKGFFASSIQRFLNYEMGKGANNKLGLVFNMGVISNIIVTIIFVLIIEIIGLWFFRSEINVSTERIEIAKIIFQISIISAVIDIISTPYDAAIIAHERMAFFSLISVIDALLRFGVILLIPLFSIDRLFFYSIALLLASVIKRVINVIYCKQHFEETHLKLCWDKTLFKEMFSFAGWQFFGNAAFSLNQNITSMLLNIFGGVAVNAARGLAFQVDSAVKRFLDGVITALIPYTTKKYSEGRKEQVFSITYFSSKVFFLIDYLVMIPMLFLTYPILDLWLVEVPDYTVVFVQLILIKGLIGAVHSPIDTLIKAEGNIKLYQIVEGCYVLIVLPISYISLQFGAPYYIVYFWAIIFNLINQVIIVFIANRKTGLNVLLYAKKVAFPCGILVLVGVIFYGFSSLTSSIVISIIFALLTDVISLLYMWFLGFSSEDRDYCLSIINKK